MNTYNECEYIKKQYIQQGILDKYGEKFESYFDYNIYPWEYCIPKCSVFNLKQKNQNMEMVQNFSIFLFFCFKLNDIQYCTFFIFFYFFGRFRCFFFFLLIYNVLF
jgi:hypothetical protein